MGDGCSKATGDATEAERIHGTASKEVCIETINEKDLCMSLKQFSSENYWRNKLNLQLVLHQKGPRRLRKLPKTITRRCLWSSLII